MLEPRGRRLGVDVGSVRIGVAVCDPDGNLATPVATVPRAGKGTRPTAADDSAAVARLRELVAESEALAVIVGLLRDLRGREALAAQAVRAFLTRVEQAHQPVPHLFYQ